MSRNAHNATVIADFIAERVFTGGRPADTTLVFYGTFELSRNCAAAYESPSKQEMKLYDTTSMILISNMSKQTSKTHVYRFP